MNFISTYSNLLKPFSFPDFLMIENHEQSALQKDLVIALFVEQVKTYFENVLLINFISIYSNLLKYFIFVHLLPIEDYEQGALRKELIIVPFAGRLKTATLRKFY